MNDPIPAGADPIWQPVFVPWSFCCEGVDKLVQFRLLPGWEAIPEMNGVVRVWLDTLQKKS